MGNKVAINGAGRIGRSVLRIIMDTPELELVAVNDLVEADDLAYMLRYDSVYGRESERVVVEDSHIYFGKKRFRLFHERDPANLPWGDLGVSIVFECTGLFLRREQLEKHIKSGARKVLLSAPPKGDGVPIIVPGVNTLSPHEKISSIASCTTNGVAPVAEIMARRIGIRKAAMTTVHAYTTSQALVDKAASKRRRGRAAALNIVPTSTGAAVAATHVVPSLIDKFDGVAIRVPVASGSIIDATFVTMRATSIEEINKIFSEESESERYRGILGVTTDQIVSSDIIRDPHASTVDLTMTRVIDGDLVKVLSWYDNEWGYASQMVREAVRIANTKENT